jgi:bifunctional UDP-N-acetylglucosamine pyrophosphorylase/glucosamine-1-phosphate N-acetyltransferase
VRIVEDKDATPEQKNIREVNSGVYAIKPAVMNLLSKIKINKKKGEYYLTDILEIAAKEGLNTGVYCLPAETELLGVNTRQELSKAEKIHLGRTIKELTEKGVVFVNSDSVYIHTSVKVGRETLIYQNVFLEGNTRVGSGCTIYPNVRLKDSTIGNRAVIKDSSVIEESTVSQNAQVGPFAHLRPGSFIGPRAMIGNFVEIKKSTIGENTKASHLSYIGDATLGKNVNIGAGTITCNYDGVSKHKTEIGDMVFVGSDTQFVAPVKIGRGAYIGAGSTITKDVPPMSLAISRTQQRNIEGWAANKKLKVRNKKLEVKREKGK